jgi:hypothetical protein
VASKSPAGRATVTEQSVVEELLEQHPDLNRVFIRFKLPCFVCGEPAWGTVADICKRHGVDAAKVVAALRQALAEKGNA